jgi:O-antigen biosynthesis protein
VQDDCSPGFNIIDVIGAEPAQAQRNPINLGFAGNCNAGAQRASGDVLLFLNQDTVAREGWFEPLIGMFSDKSVGIAGPKLVVPLPDVSHQHSNPGGMIDTIQSCGGLYGGNRGPFHRWLGWSADDWRVNVCEKVSWITGAALAIRRELFFKVGGFDVGYIRGYFEDVDLCEKAKEAGFDVWYCPESVFEHSAGTSGGIPGHIFKANSMRFHAKWDAKIKPDTAVSHVAY